MISFRSELEDLNNPVVEKDIIDLAEKIARYNNLELDEDKFRSLRLARGVYGQRQPGVQMVRIKIPYGKLTIRQLRRIADLADEYASGTLHATTRQDIQIHYVSLDDTPELWAKLEKDNITLREACGNTVRNVTAPAKAGIDPDEPFDVSPYAHAVFEYFLRNPICQEMGRKFKISFTSGEKDPIQALINDVGLIPVVRTGTGKERRGFKVYIGGGLGAQPSQALLAKEFLEDDQLIPFIEGLVRVFDRYGERARRQKARFKYLLKELGIEKVLQLIEEEQKALKVKSYPIKIEAGLPVLPEVADNGNAEVTDPEKFSRWNKSNVFAQKQDGFYGVYIKVQLGNLTTDKARALADITEKYAADDIRITVSQGYLLRFVPEKALKPLFNELNAIGLAVPGFDSTADITACPGTDTCNLGIAGSTALTKVLEEILINEYPDYIYNHEVKIKISGCPNSCSQHGIASIGFHGSSLKMGDKVLPAVQVLLGGGVAPEGETILAERVIKVPSRKAPDVLRALLDDYEEHAAEGEYYRDYFRRQGKMYFYSLLKPFADPKKFTDTDFIDWGSEKKFVLRTATGECAGVIIDLVDTLLYDSDEKLEWAQTSFEEGRYADAIYHSYNVFINSAKAMLLDKDVKNNSQIKVMMDFDRFFVENGEFNFEESSFRDHVLQINKHEPEKEFTVDYMEKALLFHEKIKNLRTRETTIAE